MIHIPWQESFKEEVQRSNLKQILSHEKFTWLGFTFELLVESILPSPHEHDLRCILASVINLSKKM